MIPSLCPIIQVKDQHNNLLYEQQFTSKKRADVFFTRNSKSTMGWGVLQGAVVPQHTSGVDLAKDLFLPTLLHFVLKIESLALRILAGFFATLFDLAFLAFRLIALPFKAIDMHCRPAKEEHPLLELICDQPQGQKAIQEGVVSLFCHMPQHVDGSNDLQVLVAAQKVALKSLPGGINNSFAVDSLDFAAWNEEYKISGQKIVPTKALKALLRHFDEVPQERIKLVSISEGAVSSSRFLVTVASKEYLLLWAEKISSENFQTELFAMREAAKNGIAPAIVKVFAEEKMILLGDVKGEQLTLTQANANENCFHVAAALRKAHGMPANPHVGPQTADLMEQCFSKLLGVPDIQKEAEAFIEAVRKGVLELASMPSTYCVSTHHQLHPGNIYLSEEEVHFLGWEQGNWEDPFYDLSYFAIFHNYGEQMEISLLGHYLERIPSEEEWQRFMVCKKINLARIALEGLQHPIMPMTA